MATDAQGKDGVSSDLDSKVLRAAVEWSEGYAACTEISISVFVETFLREVAEDDCTVTAVMEAIARLDQLGLFVLTRLELGQDQRDLYEGKTHFLFEDLWR